MSLQLRGRIMGDHGTEVNLPLYEAMVKMALAEVDVEGRAELQVHRASIARKKRAPGVYPLAYNRYVPWTIEFYLFSQCEQTGRPATLVLYNQERFAPVLRHLSKKLYGCWRESEESEFQLDDVANTKAPTTNGTTPPPAVSARIGELAYNLLLAKQHYPTNDAMFMACLGGLDPSASIEHQKTVYRFFEQLGLVERTELPRGLASLPIPVFRVTAYCDDEAENWVEEENRRLQEQWRREERRLVVRQDQLTTTIQELEARLLAAQTALEQKAIELAHYREQGPRKLMCPLPAKREPARHGIVREITHDDCQRTPIPL